MSASELQNYTTLRIDSKYFGAIQFSRNIVEGRGGMPKYDFEPQWEEWVMMKYDIHNTDRRGGVQSSALVFTQPSPWTGWVIVLHVSMCVCVSVTIFLHILLLTLNYHSPPLYAGIFILLKLLKSKHWRRDQLGPVQEQLPRDLPLQT